MMAHTLEITFDNLVDFNTKFATLKGHLMRDDFNINRGIMKIINDNPTQENSDMYDHSLIKLNQ